VVLPLKESEKTISPFLCVVAGVVVVVVPLQPESVSSIKAAMIISSDRFKAGFIFCPLYSLKNNYSINLSAGWGIVNMKTAI
jgi:hypothetical protein